MPSFVQKSKQTVKFFRRKVLRELKKIKVAWPNLNYTTAKGVLILHPSTPTIAPLNQGQLAACRTFDVSPLFSTIALFSSKL